MTDISAVVLTTGEAFTGKALKSIRQQTLLPFEILIVENEAPFSRAFNCGVSRVRTPYFVQVDSDMILDAHCFETLRRSMEEDVGLVVGCLRDPIQGLVQGVKLFRTRFCREVPLPYTTTCETDQLKELGRFGLRQVNLGRGISLGTHREEPGDRLYVFERFRQCGIKIRERQAWWNVGFRLRNLEKCGHGVASVGAVGLATGLYDYSGDLFPQPLVPSESFLKWEKLVADLSGSQDIPDFSDGQASFQIGVQMAKKCQGGETCNLANFVERLMELSSPLSWLCLIGFVGELMKSDDSKELEIHPGLVKSLNKHWSA